MQRYNFLLGVTLTALGALNSSAQTMRANITGQNGDEGKCTMEVMVDGAVDVEITGGMGRLRNLTGQPAQWRRMQCTAAMPRNPADFQLHGVDGRGNVQLIRDPNSTGGTAVVRIEDPKAGTEGYTFDVTWRGSGAPGSYAPYGQAYPNDRYPDNRYPDSRYPDPRYGPDNGRYSNNGYGRDSSSYGRDGIAACENAVRARADREFGLRDINIRNMNVDDRQGRHDWVVGSFDGRGRNSGAFDFECSVNLNNGNIRSVNIRPSGYRR